MDAETEITVLIHMHREERDQGRQTESQRSTLTNLVIVVAGALLGLIGALHFRNEAWLPASFVTILGIYGAGSSYKYYERFELHRTRANKIRDKIDMLLPSEHRPLLGGLRTVAAADHQSKYPVWSHIHLHWFWLALNVLIAVLGATALVITIVD